MYASDTDERDLEILKRREQMLNERTGPRVGDWVYLKGENEPRRFTYDWGDSIQVGHSTGECGSFYLGEGYVSYSGSLDPSVSKDSLVELDETRPGNVWFFHHDHMSAHNGVNHTMAFRVFKQA